MGTLSSLIAPDSLSAAILVGAVTYFAIWQVGLLVLRALQLHSGEPWTSLTTPLAGLLFLSLIVQILTAGEYARRPILIAVWAWSVVLWSPAAIRNCVSVLEFLWAFANRRADRLNRSALEPWHIRLAELQLPGIVGILAAAATLMVAVELSAPGQSTPALSYQFAIAPMDALAVPAAVKMLTWAFGMALAVFVHRLVISVDGEQWWAQLCGAGVVVALVPSLLQPDLAQAIGNLALTGAITALWFRDRLREDEGAEGFVLLLAICTVAAAVANAGQFLLTLILLLVGFVTAWRSANEKLWLTAAAIMPWLAVFAGLPVPRIFAGISFDGLQYAAFALLVSSPFVIRKTSPLFRINKRAHRELPPYARMFDYLRF